MNQVISARIIAKLLEGMTLPQAFDAVLGEGAYNKLAGEIWEQANAEAQS